MITFGGDVDDMVELGAMVDYNTPSNLNFGDVVKLRGHGQAAGTRSNFENRDEFGGMVKLRGTNSAKADRV